MPAKINLINQQFGKLTVLQELPERKNKSIVWLCQCECGEQLKLTTKNLRSDGIIQCPKCGSKRNPKLIKDDIIGKKFNHLTVLSETQRRSGGKILFECECDCSNHTLVYASRTDLLSGHTKSCGCIKNKYKIGDIINNRQIIDYVGNKNTIKHYYYKCKCLFCQREYDAMGQTLESTHSCGCQKSIGEKNIINILKDNDISYIKEYCFPNSLLRFDFAIIKDNQIVRLIEFDGEQHYIENVKNSGWNTIEKYNYTSSNDQKKNNLAAKYNIPLIRIPYWERNNITLSLLFEDKYLITNQLRP